MLSMALIGLCMVSHEGQCLPMNMMWKSEGRKLVMSSATLVWIGIRDPLLRFVVVAR